jgi:hypothetical protein
MIAVALAVANRDGAALVMGCRSSGLSLVLAGARHGLQLVMRASV